MIGDVDRAVVNAGGDAEQNHALRTLRDSQGRGRVQSLPRPRDPCRNQMNLEGVDIFQAKTIGGTIKKTG
jgi:hypothetical protein